MTGLVKSLLYSDRPINPKNIKFEMLKEVLLSEHLYVILEKRNADMQKIISHYKNEIAKDGALKTAKEYLEYAESIRKKRANTVLSGNSDKFAKERLKITRVKLKC